MDSSSFPKLDELYSQYGYEPRTKNTSRVYLFTKSIYNGADIIKMGDGSDALVLQEQYAKLGYAVKIRDFGSIEDAENTLFKDFFRSDGVLQNLKRRYSGFIQRIMANLPDDAQYEYIKSSYDYSQYDVNGKTFQNLTITADDYANSLVSKVVKQINEHDGPLFTIIEAAAGYGKTCTAYAILNEFISLQTTKLPFFTELSRDRQATIFKHILAFEIEEQFSNRVDSNVVIQQIKKGRIPLIIDGFDELISKDFSFSSNQFEQVESMLSTIIDLLTENAKIVITSRKTAIFNSEEFHNWMMERDVKYTLVKITIAEPQIQNWLDSERLEIISANNFPVEQVSNPVLLTYLRYVEQSDLKKMVLENQSIVKRYFDFLLVREQDRQQLLIEPEMQLEIFRTLVRILTEWDVKAETKEFIKELILEYNLSLLEETRKKYTPDKRPRVDQLADILSNHAFLDRKEKGMIGIINEFVFGILIGENLIMSDLYDDAICVNNVSQSFALLAVQSFKVQPIEQREKLWEVFNAHPFPYEPQFFFKIDIDFRNEVVRNYKMATLNDFNIERCHFTKTKQFESTTFTGCTFNSCKFSLKAFYRSSFVNCRFFNCELVVDFENYSDEYLSFYGSIDDNNFITKVLACEGQQTSNNDDIEKEILDLFFKKGSLQPRHRQLSNIKIELSNRDYKLVTRTLHKLEADELLTFNGDLSFLTRKGIAAYNEKYRNNPSNVKL